VQGDAKAQICSFCENESMDLLVVTSTLRGRIKKALSPMGGVSSQLAMEAPCPVLVLPTQASSEPFSLLSAMFWSNKSILIMIIMANNELGLCRPSLVSPEQPVALVCPHSDQGVRPSSDLHALQRDIHCVCTTCVSSVF